jgi:hypothetical protein
MNSEDLLLDLHYLSMFLAIVVPLYYWYVREDWLKWNELVLVV